MTQDNPTKNHSVTVPSHLITSAKIFKRKRDSVSGESSEESTTEPSTPTIPTPPATSLPLLAGFNHEAFNLKRAKKIPSIKAEFYFNPNRKELEHLDPDLKSTPPSLESTASADSSEDQEEPLEEYQYDLGLEAMQPFLFFSNLPPLPKEYLTRSYVLPKKTRSSPKVTLVLDLDETLVHCNFQGMADPDIVFPLSFGDSVFTIYAKIRPFYKEFIEHVSQRFEVVVFTASTKIYANRILDILDPQGKHIKFRLFRETCAVVHGTYLKDLNVLGRDLAKTIIVDNQPQVFGYQLSNGIPIPSFYEDRNDRSLLQLIPVLEDLAELDDVRTGIADRFGFQEHVNSLHAPIPTFPSGLNEINIFSPTCT